jgi:hypothetical protein
MVPLCLIWLKNMKKMLLQVTSGFFCNLSELYDSIYVISDDSKSVTHEAEIVSACDLHCYVVTVTVHQIFSSSINYATFN